MDTGSVGNLGFRHAANPASVVDTGRLAAAAFVVVSMFSNRTPFHVFITYLTFNLEASYNRILIWDFGTAEVMRNPLFGIGYGEFDRPWWMHASVDNFWLLIAMRHGLPAFFLFAAAILLIMYKIGRQRIVDPEIAACRTGLLISLGGTHHRWNHRSFLDPAVYLLHVLGRQRSSGCWTASAPAD